MQVSINTK